MSAGTRCRALKRRNQMILQGTRAHPGIIVMLDSLNHLYYNACTVPIQTICAPALLCSGAHRDIGQLPRNGGASISVGL